MQEIHKTAVLDGNIQLADDVTIGPNCVLTGDVSIGNGTRVIGGSYLTGKLNIGTDNTIYPSAHIGFAAQDINFPDDKFEPGINIGNKNVFREGVTVHRATQESPTTIGDGNMFMTNSHVAHDCQVANNTTIVSCVHLAGHVHLQDKVIIGGSANIHQFVTLGKGVMIIGMGYASYDVPPYFMVTGPNIVGSINIVGMKRSGMNKDEIRSRKEIYKLIYKSGQPIHASVEQLKKDNDAIALEYVNFIESSRRGIIAPFHPKRSERRGITVSDE
ncbi:MAG: acyl-ACP--UDP-N-acetylglucosamine O-acyltransferase [Phycisphaerales bacterium]|jgi:UDP-N-acetylglucosamine acyltransferase|nr:acyl-ACP--UDP-N-acetylglucosamine O-acyltransferase [Phycisphaerales bacterium]